MGPASRWPKSSMMPTVEGSKLSDVHRDGRQMTRLQWTNASGLGLSNKERVPDMNPEVPHSLY